MSSGVRIHTLAALLISPIVISFSPIIRPWPIGVIGMAGARLACTSAGDRPTALAAWMKAASAPQPMPTRDNVQNTLPPHGRRGKEMAVLGKALPPPARPARQKVTTSFHGARGAVP